MCWNFVSSVCTHVFIFIRLANCEHSGCVGNRRHLVSYTIIMKQAVRVCSSIKRFKVLALLMS